MSSCPICLETISSTKASPDVCDHLFCMECLSKWSKMQSFCPVDRKRFRRIINLDTGTSCEIKRRGRKRKSNALYDVSAYCEACKSEDTHSTLLLCDSCDLAYHCECLSPPLSAVPSGNWFCPVCQSIDKRLEQGEVLKKHSKESCQPSFETSNCSISAEASSSSIQGNSLRNNFPGGPSSQKNLNKESSCSILVPRLSSFPSTSTKSQLDTVNISEEDENLMAYCEELYVVPGITLIKNLTDSFPNGSCTTSTHHCESCEHLNSNSQVNINVANLPLEEDNESNFENNHDSRFQWPDVIYKSRSANSENQCVDRQSASHNNAFLREENFTEVMSGHVKRKDDEVEIFYDTLDDFKIKSSQHAAKAKMNLPKELKKIEVEKSKLWSPRKRAELTFSSKLLEASETKSQDLERTSSTNAKQTFNIIDYSRRVKRKKHSYAHCEVLNQYKACVARNAEKNESKHKIESAYDLNVFQSPFSHYNFNHGKTKISFMHFNPSDNPKGASSKQFLKTLPRMLQRDFHNLSIREDGSLLLNSPSAILL